MSGEESVSLYIFINLQCIYYDYFNYLNTIIKKVSGEGEEEIRRRDMIERLTRT